MPPQTIDEQLVKHLTDVHSIEEQALQQMRVAPRLAHDAELAQAFREHIGESETVETARAIREQEAAMSERLEARFDRAVEASLREVGPDDLDEQLNKYLADAHAIEAQAVQLLSLGPKVAGEFGLAGVLSMHLEETRAQQEAVRERLRLRGGRPSRFKDIALRGGGGQLGRVFVAPPAPPPHLAGLPFPL